MSAKVSLVHGRYYAIVVNSQLPPHYPPTKTFAPQRYYNFCTFANLIRNEKTKNRLPNNFTLVRQPLEKRLNLPINWHGAKFGFVREFRVCQYSREEPTCRRSNKFYHNKIYRFLGLILSRRGVRHSHRASRE